MNYQLFLSEDPDEVEFPETILQDDDSLGDVDLNDESFPSLEDEQEDSESKH